MATKNDVIKTVMVMAEMHQRPMSEAAAKMYLDLLGDFTPDVLMKALTQCGRKIRWFPSAAEVISNGVQGSVREKSV